MREAHTAVRAYGCGQNTRTCIYRCHTCVRTHPCLHVRPGSLCGFHFNWTDEKKKPPISNAACSMGSTSQGFVPLKFGQNCLVLQQHRMDPVCAEHWLQAPVRLAGLAITAEATDTRSSEPCAKQWSLASAKAQKQTTSQYTPSIVRGFIFSPELA